MSHIIALANQKGGVAKTTTTINLGAGLVALGKKVLLIDADPQANLTVGVGLDMRGLKHTMVDVMDTVVLSVADAVHLTETTDLDVVPSDIGLSEIEVGLVNAFNRERILSAALTKDITDYYDYILIDSPPNLGMLTVNVLSAAQMVIVPVSTHFYSLQGLSALIRRVEEVKRHLNPELKILGLLATRHDTRTNLGKEVVEALNDFKQPIFTTVIRESVRLAEAPAFGRTIFKHDPSGSSAAEYLDLAKEVVGLV